MANRKVLINRHSIKPQAPTASEMYLGEIAISHPSDLSATTIYTRNADVMVPFASCAMTMEMIDNAITAAAITYDVKAAEGDAHVEVVSGGTNSAKVFTVSSKDVMSEEEFEAYSAATKVRIDNNVSAITTLAEALSGLTDIVVTSVTGDGIVIVEPATTGSNVYSLSHKTGHESAGFNKLATDAYGHVTASTAVTTADIEALGFKTSADTDAEIEALSASVVANETHISELSAGTKHDIDALSGNVVEYVKVVSGNIETVINELSAGTIADNNKLSGDVVAYVNQLSAGTIQLSADTEAAIEALRVSLDSETAVTAGKYLTGIAIADGKISGITEADLPTLSVESAGTGNVVSSIAVNDHKITYQTVSVATSEDVDKLSAATIALSAGTVHDLDELSGATEAISGYAHDEIAQLSGATKAISGYAHDEIAALSAGTIQLSADTKATIEQLSAGTIAISGYAHGEIVELSGAVQANETDIDNLSAATLALSAVTLTGVSLNNTPLTVTDHVVSVPVADDKSDIAGATATGNVADAKAVRDYVEDVLSSSVDYKGATASAPTGTPSKGDLYIASGDFNIDGKNVETGDFIIYNGTGWDVIEKNLDGAITGNLTADTVTLGDSTNSVKSLANGASGQVLTMAGNTPAWVDDPELTVVSAGTGNVLTNITVDDHEITFTKGIIAASDADVKALSGAVEDFSGATHAKFTELSAYTKDVDDKVKSLSAGTIQLSADTKAAIEQLSGFAHNSMIARDDAVFSSAKTYADEKVAAEIALLDSSTAVTAGKYITGIAIADGKISGITEESLPANVVITATTATPVNTASAVLTGVTAAGTDNHELTFGMSNKVFSATTADSALTSESAITSLSAQTSVSADMAYKVFSAATITSGQVTDIVPGIQNTKVNSAFTAESAVTSVSATVAADAVHASAATKVDNALTVSGYSTSSASSLDSAITYDGSEAKSLTFGTVGNAGLNSMSMTSAGLVDVEVIDCGEY